MSVSGGSVATKLRSASISWLSILVLQGMLQGPGCSSNQPEPSGGGAGTTNATLDGGAGGRAGVTDAATTLGGDAAGGQTTGGAGGATGAGGSGGPADAGAPIADAAPGTGGSGGPADAGAPPADARTGPSCPVGAGPADLCAELPSGTVGSCGHDANGQPSQEGYLEILSPDGTRRYICSTLWIPGGAGGYWFDNPDRFMSDPQSCCGMGATATTTPATAPASVGYLGLMHAPRQIKPQETPSPGAGPIRHNPYAIVVRDASGAAAYFAALATWRAWAGDGLPHPAPDGTGAYYFIQLLVNYTITTTRGGQPVLVIAPEVTINASGSRPLGHPTVGACAAGGGAPLVLIAGEIAGTTLSNHSGRFGHDPSVTREALDHAAALFNCFGIPITTTEYHAPTP